MKACKKYKREIVGFIYGELEEEEKRRFLLHLEECSSCQRELRALEDTKKKAEAFHGDINKAMGSVDWESLPSQITEIVFAEAPLPSRKIGLNRILTVFARHALRPVYAGILIGILVGSLATFLLFQGPFTKRKEEARFVVSHDFLERVELEMARRETIDYLDKSQFLLLDFVQHTPDEEEEFLRSEDALEQIRRLLSEKKYINPQLDKFQMVKAKEICDQIEWLFYELTQLSDQLTKKDMERIQRLIEESQLLLKIKLLKRELKGSEV